MSNSCTAGRWVVPKRAEAFASEWAGLQADVVLAVGGTATSALKQARTVPGVFVTDTDPVAAGFVASLTRPGGNLTGFSTFERTQGPKWHGIAGCGARAASGHMAVPPRRAVNSRRLMHLYPRPSRSTIKPVET